MNLDRTKEEWWINYIIGYELKFNKNNIQYNKKVLFF